MADSSILTYERLPDNESYIRILVLEPGSGDDPLRATLLQQSLDEHSVQFDAISYCWGTPEPYSKITVKQGEIEVRVPIAENLDGALRRFRSPSKDLRLWNDALCIDQQNFREKGSQVELMGRIYAAAREVLIYLGEPIESSPGAWNLMDKIYTAMRQSPEDDERGAIRWILDNGLPTIIEPEKWVCLKDFFRQPWFRRKWTIQECVLAREPIFHLGDWERNWEFMAVVNRGISKHGLGVVDYTTYSDMEAAIELQQGLTQFNNIQTLKDALDTGVKFQLMDLATLFQESRASDLRDHLFALLDLACDGDDPTLLPDYEQSVLEVCLTYARHFLTQNGNLEVLYRAGLQGHQLLAPSWVPDWYGGHKGFGFDRNAGLWDPLRHPSFYDVAPDTQPELIDVGIDTIIGLRGTVIDEVTNLANSHLAVPGTKLDKDTILAQKRWHLEETDEILSRFHTYPTGENLAEVQWRTLICNVTHDIEQAPETHRLAYEAWRRFVLADKGKSNFEDFLAQQPFRLVIDDYNGDKVFGSTTSGYAGMFPQLARPGDKIVVLDGGEFPFVLRQNDEADDSGFELVGQCYVHGRMEQGQLDLHDPAFKRQTFWLGSSFQESASSVR